MSEELRDADFCTLRAFVEVALWLVNRDTLNQQMNTLGYGKEHIDGAISRLQKAKPPGWPPEGL